MTTVAVNHRNGTEQIQGLPDSVDTQTVDVPDYVKPFSMAYKLFVAAEVYSPLCMGNDPAPDTMGPDEGYDHNLPDPASEGFSAGDAREARSYQNWFNSQIAAEAAANGQRPGRTKPNENYFTMFNVEEDRLWAGNDLRQDTFELFQEFIPGGVGIRDAKWTDIFRSSAARAINGLKNSYVDIITVNPYFGSDGLEPFAEFGQSQAPDIDTIEEHLQEGDVAVAESLVETAKRYNTGMAILARTTNPSAAQVQDKELDDGRVLYEAVIDQAVDWAREFDDPGAGTVGLVLAGNSYEELGRALERIPAPEDGPIMPLLIPGLGTQGGHLWEGDPEQAAHDIENAEGVLPRLVEAGHDPRFHAFNYTSGINYAAHKSGDEREIARELYRQYRQEWGSGFNSEEHQVAPEWQDFLDNKTDLEELHDQPAPHAVAAREKIAELNRQIELASQAAPG